MILSESPPTYEQAQTGFVRQYALIAARHAARRVGFFLSIPLYEMSLATKTLEFQRATDAHRECADAFANAGRGLQAPSIISPLAREPDQRPA